MDRRVPAAAALLVAALLVATPLVLFPHLGQAPYDHSVDRIDRSAVPDDVTVHEYGDLSPEAQRAFDAALAAPDGRVTVYGEADRPPEFSYTDHIGYGHGIYVIEKDGRYYELTTLGGGGYIPVDLFIAVALALVAVTVGGAGVVGYRRGVRRDGTLAAGYGLVALLAVVGTLVASGPFVALVPAAVALLAGHVGVGARLPGRAAAGVAAVAAACLFAAGTYYGLWFPASLALGVVVVVPTLLGWGGARLCRRLRHGGVAAG